MNTPMTNQVSTGLSQHWVTVVDAQGRERLEARWFSAETAAAAAHAA